jgi:hypothetical protein
MVHRSMRDNSRVVKEMFIKRHCLGLDNFIFFYLDLFSCIAKEVTTLKQHQFMDGLDESKKSLSTFHFASDLTF